MGPVCQNMGTRFFLFFLKRSGINFSHIRRGWHDDGYTGSSPCVYFLKVCKVELGKLKK